MSTKIRIDKLHEDLCTKCLGRTILFSHEVDSTNNWAKELAMQKALEGTVVVAKTQTSGRGRLGRRWLSPAGGLWFSLILKPELRPAEAVKLTFVTGLAVAKVLCEMFGLEAETKWPNDVLVNGRKISGILTEMNTTGETVKFVVVGVGVNANFDVKKKFPESLRKVATSLENELGRKVLLEDLLRALLEALEIIYELFIREGFNSILEEWKSYAGFLGRQVEVISPTEKLSGLALDVDNEGALVLRLKDGTIKHVFVGDLLMRID